MLFHEIFTTLNYRGQRYQCVDIIPHVRKDGTKTNLAVMTSHCAVCDVEFEFTTPEQYLRFLPNRRCKAHRQPGVKV